MKRIGLIALVVICIVPAAYAAENKWQASYTLEGKGMYAEAIKQVEQLLERKRGNDELALLRLGWLNYLQGNYNDAKQAYRNALAKNTQSLDARLGMYNAVLAQKRWREAAKYSQEALAIAPRHLQTNLNQMAIDEHNKEWALLLKRASEMARYFPTSADTLIYLARANQWLGKEGSARLAYAKVLMLYPRNLEANGYLSHKK